MAERPNILILHTDQQRFDSLGCTGSPSARTPNLDALAKQGHVFTRHIAACPICQPSRASLLTGLYPPGHQLWTNGVALPRADHAPAVHDRYKPVQNKGGIHLVTPTLGDVFSTAGYRTAAFGKLHLTPFLEDDPSRREAYAAWKDFRAQDDAQPYYGFETYEPILGHGPDNFWAHGGSYGRYLHEEFPDLADRLNDHIASTRAIDGIRDLYTNPVPHRHSDAAWLADHVNAFIDSHPPDRPFCCFVGFPGPHHPFAPSLDVIDDFLDAPVDEPTAGLEERCGRPLMHAFDSQDQLHCLPEPWRENARIIRRYTDAMVHQIDCAVGQIIDHLHESGLWDNTVIAFTSDHGDFLGDFGLFRKACLNASQLLRVPLIMRVPEGQEKDLAPHCNRPTSNTDILPTLASLAGVFLPSPVHGVALTGDQPHDRPVFAYAYQTTNSGKGDRRLDNIAVFQHDLHYCCAPQADMEELFDLSADPDETCDLSTDPAHRSNADEMRDIAARALLQHHCPGLGKVAKY